MFRNCTFAIALLVTAATFWTAPVAAGTNDSYLYGLNWYDWQTGNYGHLGQFPVTFRSDGTADWGTLPQAWNDVLSRNLTPYISYRLFAGRSTDTPPAPQPRVYPADPRWTLEGPTSVAYGRVPVTDDGPVSVSPGPGSIYGEPDSTARGGHGGRSLSKLRDQAHAAYERYTTAMRQPGLSGDTVQRLYEEYKGAQGTFERARRAGIQRFQSSGGGSYRR